MSQEIGSQPSIVIMGGFRHYRRISVVLRPEAARTAARLTAMWGGRQQIAGARTSITAPATPWAEIAGPGPTVSWSRRRTFRAKYRSETTGCRLGCGELFDLPSGEFTRASVRVRATRLEWWYRLARGPGLWRRYVVGNPVFLMWVLGQWWSGARV